MFNMLTVLSYIHCADCVLLNALCWKYSPVTFFDCIILRPILTVFFWDSADFIIMSHVLFLEIVLPYSDCLFLWHLLTVFIFGMAFLYSSVKHAVFCDLCCLYLSKTDASCILCDVWLLFSLVTCVWCILICLTVFLYNKVWLYQYLIFVYRIIPWCVLTVYSKTCADCICRWHLNTIFFYC